MDNETYKQKVLELMEKQTKLLEKILAKYDTEIFQKPSVEEISEYLKAKGSQIDPQSFYDYYESVNWMIGKKKMKNWHSAINTWEKREKKGGFETITV